MGKGRKRKGGKRPKWHGDMESIKTPEGKSALHGADKRDVTGGRAMSACRRSKAAPSGQLARSVSAVSDPRSCSMRALSSVPGLVLVGSSPGSSMQRGVTSCPLSVPFFEERRLELPPLRRFLKAWQVAREATFFAQRAPGLAARKLQLSSGLFSLFASHPPCL